MQGHRGNCTLFLSSFPYFLVSGFACSRLDALTDRVGSSGGLGSGRKILNLNESGCVRCQTFLINVEYTLFQEKINRLSVECIVVLIFAFLIIFLICCKIKISIFLRQLASCYQVLGSS